MCVNTYSLIKGVCVECSSYILPIFSQHFSRHDSETRRVYVIGDHISHIQTHLTRLQMEMHVNIGRKMRNILFVDDKKQTNEYNEGPFCD